MLSSPLQPRERSSMPSPCAIETAAICHGRNGEPEPDPELRDTERVPLIRSPSRTSSSSDVLPHVPDAWIDESKRDLKDGQVGVVGYEINFNRYFYRYTPPRPLEDIERDIRAIEVGHHVRMLGEVTGGRQIAPTSISVR